MFEPISQQPTSFGTTGPVTVRKMRNDPSDAKFLASLSVEAFREKFVHATSVNSLPKVKESFAKNNCLQDAWFYDRVFIAESNGQPAGLLQIGYHGDPDQRNDDSNFSSIGCCDKCGLCCMFVCTYEKPSYGEAYVDHICVDENARGKGVGKLLLQKADEEARAKGCKKIYLYVSWTNRAKNLYERHGYRVTSSSCMCGLIWCMMGIKGVYKMEKDL